MLLFSEYIQYTSILKYIEPFHLGHSYFFAIAILFTAKYIFYYTRRLQIQ